MKSLALLLFGSLLAVTLIHSKELEKQYLTTCDSTHLLFVCACNETLRSDMVDIHPDRYFPWLPEPYQCECCCAVGYVYNTSLATWDDYFTSYEIPPPCNICPIGTFSPYHFGNCLTCEGVVRGMTTERAGTTSQYDCMCKPGHYGGSMVTTVDCSECPENTFKDHIGDDESCEPCPDYAPTTNGTTGNPAAGCLCAPRLGGFHPNCVACGVGTYSNDYGPTCNQCPGHSTTAGVGTMNIHECFCPDGFAKGTSILDENSLCLDINECEVANGGCDALTECINTVGSWNCTDCPENYSGNGIDGCVDINECETDNGGCGAKNDCVNIENGYECEPNDCAINNGGCDPLTECFRLSTGQSDCSDCPEGYTSVAGGSQCENINECAVLNGGCDAALTCVDTEGSFDCGECPVGYEQSAPDTCLDINECAVDNGGCGDVTCENVVGGFVCGSCTSTRVECDETVHMLVDGESPDPWLFALLIKEGEPAFEFRVDGCDELNHVDSQIEVWNDCPARENSYSLASQHSSFSCGLSEMEIFTEGTYWVRVTRTDPHLYTGINLTLIFRCTTPPSPTSQPAKAPSSSQDEEEEQAIIGSSAAAGGLVVTAAVGILYAKDMLPKPSMPKFPGMSNPETAGFERGSSQDTSLKPRRTATNHSQPRFHAGASPAVTTPRVVLS